MHDVEPRCVRALQAARAVAVLAEAEVASGQTVDAQGSLVQAT